MNNEGKMPITSTPTIEFVYPWTRILLNNNFIIFIYCNWVVTPWQWLFYMKLVTNKFKSGGLHEKHVVATWNLGNRLSICL